MSRNEGNVDRIIRGVLGVLIIVAGFYWSMWLAVLGVILLVTAAIGWCPIYAALGLSTRTTSGTAVGKS